MDPKDRILRPLASGNLTSGLRLVDEIGEAEAVREGESVGLGKKWERGMERESSTVAMKAEIAAP